MSIILTLTDDHCVDHLRRNHVPRRTVVTQRPALVLPWSESGRIATARDEFRFVGELRRHGAGRLGDHRRSDVTAVLNALRGGLTLGQLLAQAPGLRPDRLLAAHTHLDALRRDAVAAWETIVADPSPRAVLEHGDEAARLVPVPVARLRHVALVAPDTVATEVERSACAVDRARARVGRIELALDGGGLGVDQEAELAAKLFDQHGDCALAHDDYLPERVGALVPTHVSALLGEHRDGEAEGGAP